MFEFLLLCFVPPVVPLYRHFFEDIILCILIIAIMAASVLLPNVVYLFYFVPMFVTVRRTKRSYGKRSWKYVQVLFELLFCLTKFLNVAMVRNFEVVLGQTLKHSVQNSVILCCVTYL
jgi:hypothetical protein